MGEGIKIMLASLAFFAAGIGFTVWSEAASTDGTYNVWWGLMLLGALGFPGGLFEFIHDMFTGRSMSEGDD